MYAIVAFVAVIGTLVTVVVVMWGHIQRLEVKAQDAKDMKAAEANAIEKSLESAKTAESRRDPVAEHASGVVSGAALPQWARRGD